MPLSSSRRSLSRHLLAGLLVHGLLGVGLLGLGSSAAVAQTAPGGSGLPVPRFVSLRSEQVNMRTGPADTHPVSWVYSRRDLPVEITAEYKHWRRIRDWEGEQGWVHQSLLSGRRTAMVMGERRLLRLQPNDQSGAAALVDPGVIVRLVKCEKTSRFCRVEAGSHGGWLRRDELWGVYADEVVE